MLEELAPRLASSATSTWGSTSVDPQALHRLWQREADGGSPRRILRQKIALLRKGCWRELPNVSVWATMSIRQADLAELSSARRAAEAADILEAGGVAAWISPLVPAAHLRGAASNPLVFERAEGSPCPGSFMRAGSDPHPPSRPQDLKTLLRWVG